MKKFLLGLILVTAITKFDTHAQIINTVAGGIFGVSGDGGPATAAGLLGIPYIAVDNYDNLYISGYGNYTSVKVASKVRKVNAAGIIATFAGIDTIGFSGDGGMATNAKLFSRGGIAFDKKGNVYIAEMDGNMRVRKVDAYGIITTFAGNGSATVAGDGGPATAAGINSGAGICGDSIGNIYIAAGNRIRKIDTNGIISTFAGTTGGFSGDGGPATNASMMANGQIAFDKYGNLYIADVGNQCIRKVNTNGIITTVAGNGTQGFSGDNNAATVARLNNPTGVFPDGCGNLYIADRFNNRVRIVNASGIISTFAGNGVGASGGDGGPASAAQIIEPNNLYIDKHGNIYISEPSHRVRYIHMDSCRNTVGIADQNLSVARLTVSPNPSTGVFSINLFSPTGEPAEAVITDMVGKPVKAFTTTTNRETELSLHVPPGLYMVTVTTEKGRWVQKILIE